MHVAADLYFDDWTFRRQPPELLRDGARVRLQEQPLHVARRVAHTGRASS